MSQRKPPPIDEDALRELHLFIDNEYALYQVAQAMGENLKKKYQRGRYDSALAPKLWRYLVDEGARRYCKEFGGSVRTMFPVALRNELARQYAADWEEENFIPPDFEGGLFDPRTP